MPRDSCIPAVLEDPRQFVNECRWSLVALVLGTSADLFTTLWNARLYGAGVETHVVHRLIQQLLGVEAGVPLGKFAQLLCVVLVAAWWRPWRRWILLVCAALYAMAAVSNYFLLL